MFLSQNEDSAFDPFIDYGEFQDNVTEQENITFFQSGRSLNVSFLGGYEAVSFNIAHIYGDAPFVFGMALSFFYDLHFAFQLHGFFPYNHYNSLFNNSSQFSHYGIDLKYYLNKQYAGKEKDFFNPYFSFGPFWLNIKTPFPVPSPEAPVIPTPTPGVPAPVQNLSGNSSQERNLTNLERQAQESFNSFGAKVAFGFEINLIKQTFIGVEVSYLYTNLEFENRDDLATSLRLPPPNQSPNQTLLARRQFPNRPQLAGFRFFGDLANVLVLFGVNF